MAKTYDVYIAYSLYAITIMGDYNETKARPCLHFPDMSEESFEHLKAIADKGEIALAFQVNESHEETESE